MKFILRHWRGNGQIIPDIKKSHYRDYPKHSMNRNAKTHTCKQVIVREITREEYEQEFIQKWGQKQWEINKKKLGWL